MDTTTFTFVFLVLSLVLGIVGTLLHFIAPRTKNTVDDDVSAFIDKYGFAILQLVKPFKTIATPASAQQVAELNERIARDNADAVAKAPEGTVVTTTVSVPVATLPPAPKPV